MKLFSAKPRRRRNAQHINTQQVESMESRQLLSAITGLADDHGDSISTATAVDTGSVTNGNLEHRRDADMLAINVQAGNRYTFETHLRGLRDSIIELRDSNGRRLAYNDDGGRGLASRISWTADETGTVFLKVMSYRSRYAGAYQVSVTETVPQPDDHANVNSAATQIDAGVTLQGVIDAGGDRDVFELDAEAGTTYVFSTQLHSLRDSVIELQDSDGNRLGRNDDGGPGLASRLEWTASENGSVFLHVHAYRSSQSGTYSVQVSAVQDDHGNDSSNATTVSIGSSTSGDLERRGDRDWFRLDATAGQRLRISTSLGTLRDSVLSVYNAAGQRIAYNDDYRGLASRLEITAEETGPLFIQVGAYRDRYTGTYTLNVESVGGSSDNETAQQTTTVRRRSRRIVIPRIRRIRYWF